MADLTLSGSYPLPDGDNELKSWAYLANVIINTIVSNIDQDDISSLESLVAVSSTAPSGATTGRMWLDISTSTYQLKFYTGSQFVAIWAWGPAAPATTQNTPWYDTTLGMVRVYGVQAGITGWHPTSAAYQLMTNREGTVPANRLVSVDLTTSNAREFAYPAGTKDNNVVGVTMEATTSGSTGVVCVVSGGGVVSVEVDETDGAVATGDYLVAYEDGGFARTVGQRGSIFGTTRELTRGTPMGAFATALGPPDASDIVLCRMLGFVGDGAYQAHDPIGTSSLTPGPNYLDLTYAAHVDPKHSPCIALVVGFDFQMNAATSSGDGTVEIADEALAATPTVNWLQINYLDPTAAADNDFHLNVITVPTHDEANPTTFPGNTWTVRVDDSGGAAYNRTNVLFIGYWY